jgi:tripartite-type tricarboxylate transporter receptor subunit TctC
MKRYLASFCIAIAAVAFGAAAHAEDAFPSKTVRFIVPFPA